MDASTYNNLLAMAEQAMAQTLGATVPAVQAAAQMLWQHTVADELRARTLTSIPGKTMAQAMTVINTAYNAMVAELQAVLG